MQKLCMLLFILFVIPGFSCEISPKKISSCRFNNATWWYHYGCNTASCACADPFLYCFKEGGVCTPTICTGSCRLDTIGWIVIVCGVVVILGVVVGLFLFGYYWFHAFTDCCCSKTRSGVKPIKEMGVVEKEEMPLIQGIKEPINYEK
jgi:hypothetical protein